MFLVLRDAEGYSERLMLLSPIEALIAARLDGSLSAKQIAAQVSRQTGIKELTAKIVDKLVDKLDENYMLESKRFSDHKRDVLEGFRAAPVRPALLAGNGYSASSKRLTRELKSHFAADDAPGTVPKPEDSATPTGLVAPHIDFPRGKSGYAWSYGELLRSGMADLYVILGVAHATPGTPLVLTEKDYGTPFGAASVDKELARALQEKAPYDLREDELAHRNEHSIEFQAVYLKFAQSLTGGSFKILPILCSSSDLRGSDPGKRTTAVLDRLEGLLGDYPGKVCLLAGVDLAHIGPCFGDAEDVDDKFLQRTIEQDRESLDCLLAQDPEGFLDSVMRDGNRRKVCGVSALYAFSRLHKKLFPDAKGEVLHYGHAPDPTGGEVTFASLAFR